MESHLYFICPTDGIETLVNDGTNTENYFYSSLGNSIIFDDEAIWQIQKIINKKNINKIYFVLSSDNQVVLNGVEGKRDSFDIAGLNSFYNEIMIQKELSKVSWKQDNSQFSVLSYFLNKKIKEFQFKVNQLFRHPIDIEGNVYSKEEKCFKCIYPTLICMEKYRLN